PAGSATAADPVASGLDGRPAIDPVKARATEDEFDDAKAAGITGLATLAQSYPNDPRVLKALLLAHASDKAGYAPALSLAKRLFEIAPETTADDDIHHVFLLIANGPVETASTALEIMQRRMGSRGADMLYEIVMAPGVGTYPKTFAKKLLADADLRRQMTP